MPSRDIREFEQSLQEFVLRQAARAEERRLARARSEISRKSKRPPESAGATPEAPPPPLVESEIRVRCESCSRMFTEIGLKAHKYRCTGQIAVAHNLCACGRMKPKSARTCFRCETLDPGMEWMKARSANG